MIKRAIDAGRIVFVLASICSLLASPLGAAEEKKAIFGFAAKDVEKQLALERRFASFPSPESSERHLRILTEEPHVAGTPETRAIVDHIAGKFKEYGLDPEIVEYHVYLPYPASTSLEMIESREFRAANKEEGVEIDKDSYDSSVAIPFNAYSASGEVTAQVVYVNYGLPEDYEKLKELGIDVRGKIVIARYGKSFRGIKVQVAEEHGAAGVLIYSDPADDGFHRGDVYPRGPWRPWSAVQRGSVQFISTYPGDPLTPGWGATKGARRLDPKEAGNIPKIPSMPIAYRDATPLLEALAGPVVPKGWQGGLPFAYHIGPGPTKVRLKVEMDYKIRPIWNVIATIKGSDFPDEVIVLGNHHDAWTYGAVDPSSGTTVLLEVARALGELLKDGLRPRRTLILAAWDGEEYGLLGSTEWAEANAEMLRKSCAAYLNVDSAVAGENFNVGGVPSLKKLIHQVAQEFSDPATGKTIYQRWLERQRRQEEEKPEPERERLDEPRVSALGSGSDYTAFLDHLGIASLSMSFGGDYGVYHSIYDNYTWMKLFGDPTWKYHPTMAKIWGVAALRLANASILPFDYAEYGREIAKFVDRIEKSLKKQEEKGKPEPAANPGPPDLAAIKAEAERMRQLGEKVNARLAELIESGERSVFKQINARLIEVERSLISQRGLPRRPWFKHTIYAPGLYTGYAAKPLPGVAEALDKKDWKTAGEQAEALLEALGRANATLETILALAK